MKIAFITCGALAKEVSNIIHRHGWDADVVGVPASHHMYPKRIAPEVEKHLQKLLSDKYDRIIVVYGDCGTAGALDKVLTRYHIERVPGPHCYEMYAGQMFYQRIREELGTFFLTDFLVKSFRGTVLKGLGLDGFPELKPRFFGKYRRVVYLAQTRNLELSAKAKRIADYLELPLEIRYTGYGLLEERLVAMVESLNQNLPVPAHSLTSR